MSFSSARGPLARHPGHLFRMTVSYHGGGFAGFQSQPCRTAIADHLERCLAIVLRHSVRVQGASRTDRGVHAWEQVAVFRSPLDYTPRWLIGVNALLPKGVGVTFLGPCEESFHPIRSAVAKVYRYQLFRAHCFDPFLSDLTCAVPGPFDEEKFQEAALLCKGRHNFRAFANSDHGAKTTVRTIFDLKIEHEGPLVRVWLLGDGFLKQMVRILVGTWLDVARGRRTLESVQQALEGSDRGTTGPTASARGLTLCKIFYSGPLPSLDQWLKCASHK